MFSKMDNDVLLDHCSSSMQNQYFGLGSGRAKTHLGTEGKEPGVWYYSESNITTD